MDFQKWLELQAQIYDKVGRERNQRTISSQASKFVNPNNLQTKPYNSNLPFSVNNASAGNSKKKHWNFAPQQKQPSTSQKVPIKTFNTKRSCEKCKQEDSIATCPEYQLCSPGDRYNLVSQNNLSTNCLRNKHHKQSCPSQKRCQVCRGFHHTTLHDPAKQKSNALQQPFLLKLFLVATQQLRLVVKIQVKIQIHLLNRKVKQTKPPTAVMAKLSTTKAIKTYNNVI